MTNPVDRIRRAWAAAAAIGVAALGAVIPANAAPAAPLILVAPADASVEQAAPEEVAAVVSEALAGLAEDPITVKPDQESAPKAEAPAQAREAGVAVLDAGPVGEAELSLDQLAGPVEVLVTDALATAEFSIAGVTWDGDQEPGRILARAYQNDEWTDWFDLEPTDGPDPASAEGGRARAGSEPLVVAGSTAVQIQVLSQPGEDLPDKVAAAVVPLEDAEIDPAPEAAGQTASKAASGSSAPAGLRGAPAGLTAAVPAASAGQPVINPRSKWNAAAANYSGNVPKGQPVVAPKLYGAVVHHQAGTNTYTAAQVPGIVRSIQSWHMGNNGWDDIGYNFLIDKFGGIWEGRQGGIDKNVVAAHAFEFNTGSVGVCFLGDMDKVEPTSAALEAAGQLVSWRLGIAGLVSLKGNTVYPSDPKKQPRPIVSGHRDVNSTTCPGRYLYAKLDTIRSYSGSLTGVFPQAMVSRDMDGDGRDEILAVDRDGKLFMYPMASATSLGERRQIGSGWTGFTLLAPGDWDRDGKTDLIGIDPSGRLLLYAGDGKYGFGKKQIGSGWGPYTAKATTDIDGDGNPDILAVNKSTQILYLYRGDGKGGFREPWGTRVGGGWGGWSLYPAGDLNGDKLGDILGVDSAGALYFYKGVRGGGFGLRTRVGGGWLGWQLLSGGDLTGDKVGDIAGVNVASGDLNIYRGVGAGGFAPGKKIASDW
ncbi:MAG: FG-GAP-like repeat-containing protein [Bifidobacteriaceae bacterium]|jgi:hypothetical protein|nr:FG-GAP-like repeat-containing protein [Bifidobacteriaceae bacterium]